MVEDSDSIVAFSSATVASPVLISNPRFLDLSSHHSEYSSYVFCASFPSPITLASRSEIIETTCSMGDMSLTVAEDMPAHAKRKSIAMQDFIILIREDR